MSAPATPQQGHITMVVGMMMVFLGLLIGLVAIYGWMGFSIGIAIFGVFFFLCGWAVMRQKAKS